MKCIVYSFCTAMQAVLDRLEEMERANDDMARSMEGMERSMEEMKIENRRFVNIGEEMNQDIET